MPSTKRVLAVALAAFAFCATWFAPRLARATILPACELREQLSLAPAPAPLAAPHVRLGPTVDDDAADTSRSSIEDEAAAPPCDDITDVPGLAPMSDARGATVIAPPRIHAFDGGNIEATLQWFQLDVAVTPADEARSSAPAIGAGPGLVAVLQNTVPTLGPAPHPALVPAYPPPGGGPQSGVRRGIEHPPR